MGDIGADLHTIGEALTAHPDDASLAALVTLKRDLGRLQGELTAARQAQADANAHLREEQRRRQADQTRFEAEQARLNASLEAAHVENQKIRQLGVMKAGEVGAVIHELHQSLNSHAERLRTLI